MKKLLFCFGFVMTWALLNKVIYAAPLVTIAPINGYGTPATIGVSSTVFTCVPSSATARTVGSTGVYISNASTGAFAMEGIIGNCTSTSISSTVRPIHIEQSSTTTHGQYFPLRDDVCLWLISLNTTMQWAPVHYQEIKQ